MFLCFFQTFLRILFLYLEARKNKIKNSFRKFYLFVETSRFMLEIVENINSTVRLSCFLGDFWIFCEHVKTENSSSMKKMFLFKNAHETH